MMLSKTSKGSLKSAACALVSVLIAAAMVIAWLPGQAFAEVRKADEVFGKTVEERQLTVADCPSIEAKFAALVSSDGNVLFAREAGEQSQIASITKVMTAIVALDYAHDGTYVAVSERAATVGESSANLQQGDSMDLESALKALLVPSGNDAAIAIAETVGGQMIASDPSLGDDAMAAFVQKMNEKAASLGCTDTVYENPHGLDDGEFEGNLHSTAADQAKVAQCAMSYDTIRSIVGGGSTTITVDRGGSKTPVELETTDELLEMYDYAIGIKTGVTNLAGPSFMGAAEKDGAELYAIVLGSTDEMQRFRDAMTMFEWGFEHVRELKLANSEATTNMNAAGISGDVPVVAEVSHGDWIDKTVKATLANPDASITVYDLEGNVTQSVELDDLHGTVRAGQKVGQIVFLQRNVEIARQDLLACETVDAPNPIESLSISWDRFTGGFGGKPERAESKVLNVMPIISNNQSKAA